MSRLALLAMAQAAAMEAMMQPRSPQVIVIDNHLTRRRDIPSNGGGDENAR